VKGGREGGEKNEYQRHHLDVISGFKFKDIKIKGKETI